MPTNPYFGPADVVQVAQKIAEIKKVQVEEIGIATTDNLRHLVKME